MATGEDGEAFDEAIDADGGGLHRDAEILLVTVGK